jgi:chemotaxis signal transduction protein
VTGADEVVVLHAGGERYAVDVTAVDRIHTVAGVTVIPGLRPPWRGLVSLRGEILPALDLGWYLGRRPADAGRDEPPPAAPVGGAVVSSGAVRIVVLSEAPVALASRAAGGIALDVATILADPVLVVND